MGSTMATDKRGERLQLMLTPDELTLLDDFRFRARMPSRASAVRELLRRGLTAKSEDFAVTGENPKGPDDH